MTHTFPASTGTFPIRQNRLALAVILFLAIMARSWILFSSPLMPGINGAYYLVQARSILTHGTLGIPDLPLTFYIQAALAWLIQNLTGVEPDKAIILAVKSAEAILPAFVALPVYSLVRRWGLNAQAPSWLAIAAAAMAALNAPILSVTGDFEKNLLGIVWLALFLLCLNSWIEKPSLKHAAGVVLCWGLIGLTHIGVFGASLVFGGLTILLFIVTQRKSAWNALWPLLICAIVAVLLAMSLVFLKFDAQRVLRLSNALTHPADFMTSDKMRPPGGPPGMPGGMPHGGPPFFLIFSMLPSLLFGIIAIAALLRCWRLRAILPGNVLCVAGACAAGVLILTGPWVSGDKSMRFGIICIIPALLAGMFELVYWSRTQLRTVITSVFLLGLIGPLPFVLAHGAHPVLNDEKFQELRSLAPLIPHPDRTLIVARHGLEWWVAWTLHTHIAHGNSVQASDWHSFDQVIFLRSKHDDFPGTPSGTRPPPPAGAESSAQMPPEHHSEAPDHRPDPHENPMAQPEIPSSATILHDGRNFILGKVPSLPADLTERSIQP